MVSLLVFELDIWLQFGKGCKKRKIKEKTILLQKKTYNGLPKLRGDVLRGRIYCLSFYKSPTTQNYFPSIFSFMNLPLSETLFG